MDYLKFLLEIIPLAVVPLVFYIRSLQSKIDSLSAQVGGVSSKVEKMSEGNTREHLDVAQKVEHLAENLTKEVRDINQAHAAHDKEMAVQGNKLDTIIHEVRLR